MSATTETRQSQVAASQVLQRNVEATLQRTVFHSWRAFVKHRQFDVHLRRCATLMKHNTRRRMYSTYFLRWLAATERGASAEARDSYRIPQAVPLTTKKSILAFTRRYFQKWRRHNRERRQRTVANVDAILAMNDERARYRALLLWQGHALRTRMAAPAITLEAQESSSHLFECARRAVDVLGGQSGHTNLFEPSPDDTPEQAAARVEKTADALSALCEDLVVVLVLADQWSNKGTSVKVSDLLEAVWRENRLLKSDSDEKDATIGELQSVMQELLACLDSQHRRDQDAEEARHRRQEAERAAECAAQNGNDVPTQLLKAADDATAIIEAAEKGLAHQTDEMQVLQDAVAHAVDTIGSEGVQQPLRASAEEDGGRTAALSRALEKLVAEVTEAATVADDSHGTSVAEMLRNGQKQLAEAKQSIAQLTSQLKAAQKELADARDELEQDRGAGQQKLTAAGSELAAEKERAAELGRQLDQSNDAVEKLEAQLEEQTTATQQASDALKAAKEEAAHLSETVERQTAAINDLERSNQNAAKRLDQLADQLEAAQKELADARDELEQDRGAGQQKLTAAGSELAAEKERAAELGRQLDQSNDAVEKLEAQLEEQTTATQQASDALKAAKEEAAHLSETVERQTAAINDLERSNQNAAKRLDQLADQFEVKSREYRDKEAQQAVELTELQAAVERALVTLQGQEQSDSLLDTALSSSGGPSAGAARSRALVDALDVACHSLDGVRPGESVTECIYRAESGKAAAEAQLQARQDAFDKLEHIVAVANDLLLRPRLSEVSIEAAGAVAAAEALAADGAAAAKALMSTVHDIVDEACTCLETLPKAASAGEREDPLNSTAGESVKEVLKMCGDALYESTGELTASMQATASNEALSVFLRDIVRDAIGRVAALANNLCASMGGETSPSAWQSLQLTDNPMTLSMDRDPSEYVEYILRNVDLSDEGKRAVQDHLRSEATLVPKLTKSLSSATAASAKEKEGLGSTLDPSTSQERRAEADGPAAPSQPVSPPPCTWDVVAEFHDLLAMLMDLSMQHDEKFAQQVKEIHNLDGAMRQMIADLGLPEGTTPSNVARTVEEAVRACQVWRSFADDCLEALGHHVPDNADSTATCPTDPLSAEEIGAKLLAECSAATDGVHEIKRQLGLSSGSPLDDGALIENDLKGIRGQINQLQSLRDESDAFIQGLNRAFDDETLSTSTTSTLSSRGRSLRSKKKPLPATLVKAGEVFSLKKGDRNAAKSLAGMTADEKLRVLRTSARDKLEEVQELRRACRATLFILEGTYGPSKKAPAYGEALVPRLLQQLEDLKRALPLTDAHVSDPLSLSGTDNADRTSITVGARLATLASMVNSLQLTQAGLEESLAAKARQGAVVLQDIQNENTRLKAQHETAKLSLQESQQGHNLTKQHLDDLSMALAAQTGEAEQSQAEAMMATKALRSAEAANAVMEAQLNAERDENQALTKHAAVLQHEANVLADALSDVLASLAPCGATSAEAGMSGDGDAFDPATATKPSAHPASQTERGTDLQRLVKVEDGAGVMALVRATLAQHRQWLSRLGHDYQTQLQGLRWDLAELKAYAEQEIAQQLQPLCAAVLREAEDSVQLLCVENDMLRPRALEREALLEQNAALHAALDGKDAELRATQAALQSSDEQNARLRRAQQDAAMARLLDDDGDDDDDGETGTGAGATPSTTASRHNAGKAGTHTNTTIDLSRYMRSSEYAALMDDLEAKMIRGATAMTVEAMDAMSGQDMGKAFGAVAEDTCELYGCIQQRVQAILDAFSLYPPTNTFNQRCLEEAVEAEMQALNQHASRAKELWGRLPPFFAPSYARV